MRSYLTLVTVGASLVALATLAGGLAAGAGGVVALAAQIASVAVLRPAMKAPQPVFFQRWLAGMGIRLAALIAVMTLAAAHRRELPPLETSLGFLGVLLPLLFLETRFLR